MSGSTRATASSLASIDVDERTPLSYSSTGSSERSTPSAASSSAERSNGSTVGTGCTIRPKTMPPDSSRSSVNGHDADVRLERDRLELQRRGEDEGRAERRVTGERELGGRREDPNPRVPALAGRQDVHRLREPDLERERAACVTLVELAGVGEDRELVARERGVGEDVGDDVTKRAHRPDSSWPLRRRFGPR